MKDDIVRMLEDAITCIKRDDRIDAADSIKTAVFLLEQSYAEQFLQRERDYSGLDIPDLLEGSMCERATVVGVGHGAFIKTWQGQVFYAGISSHLDASNARGNRARKGLARILDVPMYRIAKWRKAKRERDFERTRNEKVECLRAEANLYGYVLKPFDDESKKC